MISVLFSLLFVEMALILALLFRTPLRNLLVVGIDKLKRGRGPLVAKTVAATLLVVFSAILYSVMEIRKRALEAGVVNSTDEVLMAERLLEASLMGFSLFLAMMADRLHYHMKELYRLREELEQVKKSKQEYGSKESWRMGENEGGKVKEPETVSKRKARTPLNAG
ncbi:hypothetical protein P3X46_027206 [Hevea brasiliensis]|uniref:Endoplasmic reticulum transmembrane protein n=1 Tax=Hevea brasiliensis TaxID=3981 RepID=A0ABQ9L2M2_HEVBR|nr:uncharacterized protein LOC110673473 [Hevea brasiliensis]KAJ9153804.1 hypothetical protein P3X46_027206 [Hevea brasiliensis]